MTDHRYRVKLIAVAAVAVVLALAGCGGDGSDLEVQRRIAHVCDPMKNVGVDYHGPGWSVDGRYEVTCEDGSQRIVFP